MGQLRKSTFILMLMLAALTLWVGIDRLIYYGQGLSPPFDAPQLAIIAALAASAYCICAALLVRLWDVRAARIGLGAIVGLGALAAAIILGPAILAGQA